ncbi:hypothetical protein CB1_000594011 [Camelus ferus]|nr:hypothetical protein CB1_000594011 [Camelus ferus]
MASFESHHSAGIGYKKSSNSSFCPQALEYPSTRPLWQRSETRLLSGSHVAKSLEVTLGCSGASGTPRLTPALHLKGQNWTPRSPLGKEVPLMEDENSHCSIASALWTKAWARLPSSSVLLAASTEAEVADTPTIHPAVARCPAVGVAVQVPVEQIPHEGAQWWVPTAWAKCSTDVLRCDAVNAVPSVKVGKCVMSLRVFLYMDLTEA